MALKMAQPWKHPKTGVYYFRKAVPFAIRTLVGKTEEVRSLHTKDQKDARVLFLRIAVEVAERWEALTAEKSRLSQKQIQGLAGEYYRWFIARHDEDPGRPQRWLDAAAEAERIGRKYPRRPNPAGLNYLPKVEEFLAEKGITIDDADVYLLACAVVAADRQAKEALARHAGGDWSPDPKTDRFPKWEEVEPKINARMHALTLKKHWDKFAEESELKPASAKRWRPVLEALCRFAKTDNLAEITPNIMFDWKKELKEVQGKSARTVNDVYLAAARSFFNWAIENRKLTKNPVDGVKVREKRTRKTGSALTQEQAEAILAECLRPPQGRTTGKFAAAKRWAPWLCAYSGARINEITQMRREDVYTARIGDQEIWAMKITPEAGSVKTDVEREVPLYPHLVEQGFIDFVKGSPPGPLFYDPKLARHGKRENPQYVRVGGKLAEWVRDYAIGDDKVQPNHGWRHKFNRDGREVRMDPEVRDAIAGHAPRTEGEKYGGDVPLGVKWIEINRLERYRVEPPQGPPVLKRERKAETPEGARTRVRKRVRPLRAAATTIATT